MILTFAIGEFRVSSALAQAVAIPVVAVLLFISQRYWVFAATPVDAQAARRP